MMTLKIGRRLTLNVASLADASVAYSEARDASGEGASTFPEGRVSCNATQVARISYNGRVWPPGPWKPGDVPLIG
jgi:hypothetical protein